MKLSTKQKQKQVVIDQMYRLLRDDEAKPENVEEECGITEAEYDEAVRGAIRMLERQWGLGIPNDIFGSGKSKR